MRIAMNILALGASGLVLAGCATTAPPQASPKPGVTAPHWLARPSGIDFARAYPEAAMRKGLGGQTVMHCSIGEDTKLHDCSVVSESPPGLGFGAAALRVATAFRIQPATKDGVFIPGSVVDIPLAWSIR